jgi:hypothetical protein
MNKSLICLLVVLFRLSVFGDEVKPPENMQEHFEWAQGAEKMEERIERLESFWRRYLPSEEGGVREEMVGYGDATHGLAVAGCAWDLARAYVAAGEKTKALEMMDWIQKYDSRSALYSEKEKEDDDLE